MSTPKKENKTPEETVRALREELRELKEFCEYLNEVAKAVTARMTSEYEERVRLELVLKTAQQELGVARLINGVLLIGRN